MNSAFWFFLGFGFGGITYVHAMRLLGLRWISKKVHSQQEESRLELFKSKALLEVDRDKIISYVYLLFTPIFRSLRTSKEKTVFEFLDDTAEECRKLKKFDEGTLSDKLNALAREAESLE